MGTAGVGGVSIQSLNDGASHDRPNDTFNMRAYGTRPSSTLARAQGPSRLPEPQLEASVRRLIVQLGDESFTRREEATRKLIALGETSLPALEQAKKDGDLEIRLRAESIIEEIGCLRRERLMREILEGKDTFIVDRFIDRMARWKEFDTPQNWERLHLTAEALTRYASKIGGRKWNLPELDYRRFPTKTAPLDNNCLRQKIRIEGIKLLPGGVLPYANSIHDCMLVSSGSLPIFCSLARSIVFVNGDLEGCAGILDSFVFCNGNIGRVTSISNSIVLATGDFAGSTGAHNSFFQVRSVGQHTGARRNVYLNVRRVPAVRAEDNRILEIEKGPLQVVTFFDPLCLGVAFSTFGGRVRIDKVHDGKVFARAGLLAGDVVVTVDGDDLPSAQELWKFLRQRIPGDEFDFVVRRGKKIVSAKVKIQD